jgi:AraC-like DNA-binding protein
MRVGEATGSRAPLSLNTPHVSFKAMRMVAREETREWLLRLIRHHFGKLRAVRVRVGCSNHWLYDMIAELDLWPDVVQARKQRALIFGDRSVHNREKIIVAPNSSEFGLQAAIRPHEASKKLLTLIKKHKGKLGLVALELGISERTVYSLINSLGLKVFYMEYRAELRSSR